MFYKKGLVINTIIGILIIFKLFRESAAVRIINLKIPPTYTLENRNNPEPLILDCEYEIGPEESGFVLKWLLDNVSIYQWIPNNKGFPLGFMKTKIDATYLPSENNHRAISIYKPEWNMTGEYTCLVQTFESTDKKSGYLQIIIPETEFGLNAKLKQDDVDIKCIVIDVFPKPSLSIMLGENKLAILSDLSRNSNGLYSNVAKAKIPRDQIDSPMPITCILTLPGTNYTKRRETLFYDQGVTTTIIPNEDEISSAISRLEAEEGIGRNGVSSSINHHHHHYHHYHKQYHRYHQIFFTITTIKYSTIIFIVFKLLLSLLVNSS